MRPQKWKRFQCKGYRTRMIAGNAVCICPQCGYTIPHIQGNPCYRETCPFCHIPLIRKASASIKTDADTTKSESISESITKKLPEVNTDLCIGCGVCESICPRNAISVIDGKAFINPDECGNCRICENECPNRAIH